MVIINGRFRRGLYSITAIEQLLLLLNQLSLGSRGWKSLRVLELTTQLLDILVELVVVPADVVSLLFQVLIIIFEVFLTNLAVIGRGSQVLNFLRYPKKYQWVGVKDAGTNSMLKHELLGLGVLGMSFLSHKKRYLVGWQQKSRGEVAAVPIVDRGDPPSWWSTSESKQLYPYRGSKSTKVGWILHSGLRRTSENRCYFPWVFELSVIRNYTIFVIIWIKIIEPLPSFIALPFFPLPHPLPSLLLSPQSIPPGSSPRSSDILRQGSCWELRKWTAKGIQKSVVFEFEIQESSTLHSGQLFLMFLHESRHLEWKICLHLRRYILASFVNWLFTFWNRLVADGAVVFISA